MSEINLKNLIHKEVCLTKASEIVSILDERWCKCAYEEFIALDIETTGLGKGHEHILEVAAIRYRKCKEIDKFVSLINPLARIPYYVSQIHGITNETVKDSPTIDVVLPQLLDFMGNSIIVAHNAHFDIGFIEVWARRLGYDPYWNYIDTISVARKVLPGLPNYKQHTILNAIGYVQDTYHRAEADVRGCVEIIMYAFDKIRRKAKTVKSNNKETINEIATAAIEQLKETKGFGIKFANPLTEDEIKKFATILATEIGKIKYKKYEPTEKVKEFIEKYKKNGNAFFSDELDNFNINDIHYIVSKMVTAGGNIAKVGTMQDILKRRKEKGIDDNF